MLDSIKEVYVEVNTDKTEYTSMFRHQNRGQNLNLMIDNKSVENGANYKYLGRRRTNKNLIQEEIKSRLNSGNDCYRSGFSVISKYLKIKIY